MRGAFGFNHALPYCAADLFTLGLFLYGMKNGLILSAIDFFAWAFFKHSNAGRSCPVLLLNCGCLWAFIGDLIGAEAASLVFGRETFVLDQLPG